MYKTRGVEAEMPLELQYLILDYIKKMPVDRDYLQVFILSKKRGKQKIIHRQEKPKYNRRYLIKNIDPINAKIYVIDDGDYATMILASEY